MVIDGHGSGYNFALHHKEPHIAMSCRYTPFAQYAAAARDGDLGDFIYIDPDESFAEDYCLSDPGDADTAASSNDCDIDEFLHFCALSSPPAVTPRRQTPHGTRPIIIRYIPLTFAAAAPAA